MFMVDTIKHNLAFSYLASYHHLHRRRRCAIREYLNAI